jgi:hypothetical protein
MIVNHSFSSGVLILLLPFIRRPHLSLPPSYSLLMIVNDSYSSGVLILLLPFIRRPHLSLPPGSWQLAKCLLCLELAALLGTTSKFILRLSRESVRKF